MTKITVNLGARSYQIFVGQGIMDEVGGLLKPSVKGKKAFIVSSETVYGFYGSRLEKSLVRAGFSPVVAIVPDGETNKSLASAAYLYDLAFNSHLDRGCPVLALGGGVTGDLAGFVAATYMRGVPFVQVPTTLLAQVDSSIGGKTAVNHARGKNIIGVFYQPVLVAADTGTLRTLPDAEMRSGLAEVIKIAAVMDINFFYELSECMEKINRRNTDVLEKVITTACRLKAGVVEGDEREQGARAILNFGHTIGHAVESLTAYSAFKHGEAVSIGMSLAARLARELGLLTAGEQSSLENLLLRAGLPVDLPSGISAAQLLRAIKHDKKGTEDELTVVLPHPLGKGEIRRNFPVLLLQEFLSGQEN